MAAGGPKRILIVDDSAVMRSLLRSVVSSVPGFEVSGTAADGTSALSSVDVLRPDLVLLDVEMPVMDGLVTLKQLRARGHKMPVLMCSSLTQHGARVTLDALAAGASDYVAKPSGQASREDAAKKLALELGPKMVALTSPAMFAAMGAYPGVSPGQRVGATDGIARGVFTGVGHAVQVLPIGLAPRNQAITTQPAVLVIGASTGGPAALDTVLSALPGDFPLPVMLVQHMPELFTRLFAERLDGHCRLRAREAVDGEPVRTGTIYVARGNWHMEARSAVQAGLKATLHLTQGPPENHCRPAVDVLFRSAAAVYGSAVLAVVLTGMGADGMLGSRAIRAAGGAVVAQDEASSIVWGMPGAVTNAGLAQKVLTLDAIAPEIVRLCSRSRTEARELREAV
jgi:two-component system chemotaxis response regulator CheB